MPAFIKDAHTLNDAALAGGTITVPAIASGMVGAVKIDNTLNTGVGFQVYTNIGAASDQPLIWIDQDNAAFDQNVIYIKNDSATNAIYLVQSGNTTAYNGALSIQNTANTGSAIWVYTDLAAAGAQPLIFFYNDNVNYAQPILSITNDGTGADIHLNPAASAGKGAGAEGDIYYNVTTHALMVRTNAGWKTVTVT